MTRRPQDRTAFRAAPAVVAAAPNRRQARAMLAGLLVAACAVALASYVVKPSKIQAFDLFYGSLFINDQRAPVAVDLTNGEPTVRLDDASAQVRANDATDLEVVPLDGGTLFLNRATGEFNFVDVTGLFVKQRNGGVQLSDTGGATRSTAIASGPSAYIVQAGLTRTSVYLVGRKTVASAVEPGAKATDWASIPMTEPGSTDVGSQAATHSDLWMLVGAKNEHAIRRLSPPAAYDEGGKRLQQTDFGSVTGVAAIGVAQSNTDETGSEVIGVASADRIQLFRDGTAAGTVTFDEVEGVDRILPASNEVGRLAFLYHSPRGWSVVSVSPAGDGRMGPTALPDIKAGGLAAPATSRGRLYTMDTGTSGAMWQITYAGVVSPVPSTTRYPIAKDGKRLVEVASLDDAYVVARGSRVIFNSPSHITALAVFTDGSHAPVGIDKRAATRINAAGGAAALVRSAGPDRASRPKPGHSRSVSTPVDNKLRCQTTNQVPHVPNILTPEVSPRSVQLDWDYVALDPQDCIPREYRVHISTDSADAPEAPDEVPVSGQTEVTIVGLYPSTHYQFVVTAILNGHGTPSEKIDVTTAAEGPKAPTNVRTEVVGDGNWLVTWESCAGIDDACAPSTKWNVIPQYCENDGLFSAPRTISIIRPRGERTYRAVYRGTVDMLGRGLQFRVQGIGEQSSVGDVSDESECKHSWRRPDADAMQLTASQPDDAEFGAPTTVTARLDLGTEPTLAAGGAGATFRFELLSANRPVQHTAALTEPTTTFANVDPTRDYEVRAFVSPPKQPTISVPIGPVRVATRSAWPKDLRLSASFASDGGLNLFGTLRVGIGAVSSATAKGERFDLTDNSKLVCGNGAVSYPLRQHNFDPGAGAYTIEVKHLLLLTYHGTCTVFIELIENLSSVPSTSTPYFGGTASGVSQTQTTLGEVPTLDAKQSAFTADWSKDTWAGQSYLFVRYTGEATQAEVDRLATAWTEVVQGPSGQFCGPATTAPWKDKGVVVIVFDTCVDSAGTNPDGGVWKVAVSYEDAGKPGSVHTFVLKVAGRPPTYTPKPK